jgi:hypothetical protein
MEIWCSHHNKNKIKKILLGNIYEADLLEEQLKKHIPEPLKVVLRESHEDLANIKKFLETWGIGVFQYQCRDIYDLVHVRNDYVICDDSMYICNRLPYLAPLYDSVKKKLIQAPAVSRDIGYCPNIFLHDDYCILDGLPKDPYMYFREKLRGKRKIITALNEGHSDGIYTNIADKAWLTNGEPLNFSKYFPGQPVYQMSTTAGGTVNDWMDLRRFDHIRKELEKTSGRYFIYGRVMDDSAMTFVDEYLKHWVGYCDETLFDMSMLVLDPNNVMAISENSKVYDFLEGVGVKVHRVQWRHRFFWDGGLHCITNELERERNK